MLLDVLKLKKKIPLAIAAAFAFAAIGAVIYYIFLSLGAIFSFRLR